MNWLSAVGGEFGGSSWYAVSENITSPIAWFAATIPNYAGLENFVSLNMTSPIPWFAATIPFSVVATRA